MERAREARRGVRIKGAARGHSIGLTANDASGRIHVPGSITTQLLSGADLSDGISPDNIRYHKIAGRGRRNILFIIDTSGSMLSDDRFATVKGYVISLLENSYAKRLRVAIVSCGGGGARLELPFTSSAELAAKRIENLKGGGTTPLVQATGIAANIIEQLKDENLSIYLLSDGRYNRSRTGKETGQLMDFGSLCKARQVPLTLINSGPENRTAIARTALLARRLQASCLRLGELRAEGSV